MVDVSSDLLSDIPAYCERHNLVGSLANVSALLKLHFERVNWVGFYLFDGDRLRLGPFQGRPACTEIMIGRGVCGTAALQQKSLRVDDVDQFPGHIVCDSASRSELVVPILQNGKMCGVLDVDSPEINRFSSQDQILMENVVSVLTKHLDFVKGSEHVES